MYPKRLLRGLRAQNVGLLRYLFFFSEVFVKSFPGW